MRDNAEDSLLAGSGTGLGIPNKMRLVAVRTLRVPQSQLSLSSCTDTNTILWFWQRKYDSRVACLKAAGCC